MRTSSSDETARRTAFRGLLLCLALIFSYLEAQLPLAVIPVPGVKLGFANLVVSFAAYVCGMKTAAAVSLLRVCITSLLFGSPTTFWFSVTGAVFSLCILAFLLRIAPHAVSPLGVSVACAAAHNAGQLAAAAILLSPAVTAYLPVLLFAGMAMGTVTGLLLTVLLRAIPSSVREAFRRGTAP